MEQKKTNGHGGARPGAGRKKGGTNNFTIETLMQAVQAKANGQPYEELLAEDFIHARQNDRGLAQKYHNLILSKIAPSLQKIETTEGDDAVQAKAEAFAEALQDLVKSGKAK